MTRSATTATWSVVAVLLVLAHAAASTETLVCGQTDSEFATAHIACPPNTVITQIPFAAYGLPGGSCPNYVPSSTCDAKNALRIVAGLCLGRSNCSVEQNGGSGPMGDPCWGVGKRLRVVVQCGPKPKAPLPSLAPSQGSYVCASADREHTSAALNCPPGSVVKAIPFASYGLPTGRCPDFVENARCHSNATLSVVAGLCMGRTGCSIEQNGDNGPMGDPCWGVGKRLRVVAQCAPVPSTSPSASPLPSLPPSSRYVCGATDSEYTSTRITCPAGSTIIAVPFASYGTPTGTCPNFSVDPGCDARGMRDYVASLCMGKASCSVEQNDRRGDPCWGVGKRVRIVVECAPLRPIASATPSASSLPLPSQTATPSSSPVAVPSGSPQPVVGSSFVCGASDAEYDLAHVNCPANWVVDYISFASYGLPTGECPCYQADARCDARGALDYASSLCLGRNNCSIQQNGWGVLGDPCPNIYKRLRVVARCIPPAHQEPAPGFVESLKWLPRCILEVLLWLA